MNRKHMHPETAGKLISLIASTALLGFLVFWWGAHNYTAVQPLAAEAQQLPGQLQLLGQLEELEQQLASVREQAQQAQTEANKARLDSSQAQQELERALSAPVEVVDGLFLEYSGEYYATAYCCERYPHICGGNGVTASGTAPTPGLTVAADWSVLPAGTWLYIEGVGMRRVEDTGSAIKGKRLDVAIDTHANALRWQGQGNHHVWVLNWQ